VVLSDLRFPEQKFDLSRSEVLIQLYEMKNGKGPVIASANHLEGSPSVRYWANSSIFVPQSGFKLRIQDSFQRPRLKMTVG